MKIRNFLILCLAGGAAAFSSGCAEQKPVSTVSASPASQFAEASTSADSPIRQAEILVERAPDSPVAYAVLSAAYIKSARETGDFALNAKAEAAARRALELDPANLAAQKLNASLHLTFHRFADALEAGKKLQRENPRDPFVYGVLTDANIELGNYQDAVEAGQTMVDLRPNMESYARVALLRSLYGESAGAIEAMSLAARVADPQDREAQSWCLTHLGEEYFKIGKFNEAEKQYDAALQILPNYHLALAGKAKARAAQGDFDAAIKLYTEAQNRVPLVEAVIALGDLYALKGEAEKARAQYDLAEVMEQKFGGGDQRRLALLWADRDVRLDEALTIAAQEKANRKDIYTADVYAWTLYKKGKFSEAKTAINEAMKLKTKDARIFYHAGMIEKALGNAKEARRYLNLALETNPAFDLLQAEKARAALRELS
jgi:tetratricopeptide (TPR) repeat protein